MVVTALSISVYVLLPPKTHTITETRTDWTYYLLPSGPGVTNNRTLIPDLRFCPPPNATSLALFSMVWRTSTGAQVKHVGLYALYPSDPTHPLPYAVTLYLATNASSGGTAFLTYFPGPCGTNWDLGSDANTFMVVGYTLALTYNVTVTTSVGALHSRTFT